MIKLFFLREGLVKEVCSRNAKTEGVGNGVEAKRVNSIVHYLYQRRLVYMYIYEFNGNFSESAY